MQTITLLLLAMVCCAASCAPNEPAPRLPQAGGDVVYSANNRAFTCEDSDEPCFPQSPAGALKARCMDVDHSIRLCNCEWVCSGPLR